MLASGRYLVRHTLRALRIMEAKGGLTKIVGIRHRRSDPAPPELVARGESHVNAPLHRQQPASPSVTAG